MKKATLVLLAIAFLAGLAAVASAKPFDVQEQGNDHHWKHNGPSSGLDMKEHSYGVVGWANFGKILAKLDSRLMEVLQHRVR